MLALLAEGACAGERPAHGWRCMQVHLHRARRGQHGQPGTLISNRGCAGLGGAEVIMRMLTHQAEGTPSRRHMELRGHGGGHTKGTMPCPQLQLGCE